MIEVIIADDHPIVRAGLKQIIMEQADISVAAEAANGIDLLRQVRERDYDVILLDLTMPGMDGLDVLKQLRIEKPRIPVVILTIHPESQYALRILKAGAAGYLTKASADGELIKAIRKVHRGGKYISPSLAERIAFALDEDTHKLPHETLSDREYQVLCLIGTGKTVSRIADELALSVKTVSTYRTRILEKMRMENNAELIHYAVQNGLVE
ncbi:DNA-binding response regulator [Desulfosarcina ovata subsp. sediminis]|uniref:DNA-binding response regulator n=1 Tax=Desulfosarcina ovata subsp. sediminis TaxID=885957 RepID=A0A5K7ZSV3_9BACT|nr:response regulator transcription factor [Desulfosarcina ovata]BBO83296.1 DNA-binding response regulator [Desulfosarcina ovata subsp. sediminis]